MSHFIKHGGKKICNKINSTLNDHLLCLSCLFLSQGDYDPVKTRVLHLKMNPTAVAKQQRQQEEEVLREEVTRLRELVRSLQDGGAVAHSQDGASVSLSLPPSKEVQGKNSSARSFTNSLVLI